MYKHWLNTLTHTWVRSYNRANIAITLTGKQASANRGQFDSIEFTTIVIKTPTSLGGLHLSYNRALLDSGPSPYTEIVPVGVTVRVTSNWELSRSKANVPARKRHDITVQTLVCVLYKIAVEIVNICCCRSRC